MTSFRDAQMEAQADFHAHEMNTDDAGDLSPNKMLPARQRTWAGWSEKLKQLTGLDNLDGENSEAAKAAGTADGYSLDECVEWFEQGWSPERAANSILDADGRYADAQAARAERNFGC